MRLLELTEQAIELMRNSLLEKFNKDVKDYKENRAFKSQFDFKFSFNPSMETKPEDKIVIYYTPEAYEKMWNLVDYFKSEVGWYGLVEDLGGHTYRVYDVKVCKQTVSGAKVDTTDEDILEFMDSLSDEEINALKFQAHSHVNFATTASAVDIENQTQMIEKVGNEGFYIFQIWNKKGDINTYFYDLTEGIFYDRDDVIIKVETSEGTMDDFLAKAEELVKERKEVVTTYNQYSAGQPYNGYVATKGSAKTQKKESEQNFSQVEKGNHDYNRFDFQ